MKKTPDQMVAARIATKFREKELVDEGKLKSLEDRLASGNLSAEDWKLLAKPKIEKVKGIENG